jgi:hypothetical protein
MRLKIVFLKNFIPRCGVTLDIIPSMPQFLQFRANGVYESKNGVWSMLYFEVLL